MDTVTLSFLDRAIHKKEKVRESLLVMKRCLVVSAGAGEGEGGAGCVAF